MKHKLKRAGKRAVPLILVFCLTLGLVTGANTKEVKAVAGVDDALIVIALLAMCGVAYTGINYAWHGGQGWVNDGDVEFPDADLEKWKDGFNEKWQKQWDEEVKKQALEKGLIDEDGNIVSGGSSGGSSGGGGDDDNNKFPSWKDVKNLASTQKNLGIVLSTYLPFVALFGYKTYEDSKQGSKTNTDVESFNSLSIQTAISELESKQLLNLSQYNSKVCYTDGKWWGRGDLSYMEYVFYYGKNWFFCTDSPPAEGYVGCDSPNNIRNGIAITVRNYKNGIVNAEVTDKEAGAPSISKGMYPYYYFDIPYTGTYEECSKKDGKKDRIIVSPATITENTTLSDYLKENDNKYPVVPIFNNTRVPTDEEFSQYLKDLKDNKDNNNDDEEKKKAIVDDFIKKLTTETTDPTPDPGGGETPTPTPDPGGDSGNTGGTDTPDTPSTDTSDNENYTRDLKMFFPFCIPFDLVDCFRLFNAEPETPRIEVPMHFDIVDVDYTWVIDLKDFNSVAVICRTMFLILFLIGLAFATSKVIKW